MYEYIPISTPKTHVKYITIFIVRTKAHNKHTQLQYNLYMEWNYMKYI